MSVKTKGSLYFDFEGKKGYTVNHPKEGSKGSNTHENDQT
jgi:hypothetical protein